MRKLANSELNRLSNDEFKNVDKLPLTIILDNVRSMNNIGSVFRTSDAFRVEQIFLCGITAQPPHKDIHKTALGATESVHWEYFKTTVEAIEAVKKKGYRIAAIEQAEQSIMLDDYEIGNERLAIVFGNEVKGVEEDVMLNVDECIEIPQFGTKHSLNISVSAGVVVWHLFHLYKKMNIKLFE